MARESYAERERELQWKNCNFIRSKKGDFYRPNLNFGCATNFQNAPF